MNTLNTYMLSIRMYLKFSYIQAYPAIGEAYNSLFGGVAAVYNGVPFLPFAIFFLMSYICRAPTFPVEVRFHFAQAFMISLIQFVPSLTFGLLEKAGVPGMAVLYNTGLGISFYTFVHFRTYMHTYSTYRH